jgi:hypothetical protein
VPSPVFLLSELLLLGQAVVIQYLAHPHRERYPLFGAQVEIGELVYQVQELFALVIVQWFGVLAVVRLCCRRSDLQTLFDPVHGGILVFGHRLVVDAGVDPRGIQAFLAQECRSRAASGWTGFETSPTLWFRVSREFFTQPSCGSYGGFLRGDSSGWEADRQIGGRHSLGQPGKAVPLG